MGKSKSNNIGKEELTTGHHILWYNPLIPSTQWSERAILLTPECYYFNPHRLVFIHDVSQHQAVPTNRDWCGHQHSDSRVLSCTVRVCTNSGATFSGVHGTTISAWSYLLTTYTCVHQVVSMAHYSALRVCRSHTFSCELLLVHNPTLPVRFGHRTTCRFGGVTFIPMVQSKVGIDGAAMLRPYTS